LIFFTGGKYITSSREKASVVADLGAVRYDQAHARSVENNSQIGESRLAPILFGGWPKALAAISECV
jgi:hypothetical protein